MPRIDSKMQRGAVLGLLQFAYHSLTTCIPCSFNFVTVCYMPRIDSKLRRGTVLGLLQFAYPFLTTCFPCPYNSLCYMPRVDSQMKKLDSFRVWCCVHTIPLPIAHHVFIISSLFATCPELTASCEGSRFGVAAVCIPFPYHFLPMSLQFLYCVLHAQHAQQDARGNRFGLAAVCMSLPYHLLPMSSQFLTICYMRRIDNQMRKEPFWGCCCLHTLPLPLASHVLTISSPSATCPELTANCEGIRFGVAAVCITYPYQLLNMSLQCPHHLLHVQN